MSQSKQISVEETWFEVMKKHKPDLTEREADYILWNFTCYPFDDEMTLKQIENFFLQSKTNKP